LGLYLQTAPALPNASNIPLRNFNERQQWEEDPKS